MYVMRYSSTAIASNNSKTLSSLSSEVALELAHMYTGYCAGLSLNMAICDQLEMAMQFLVFQAQFLH